jgi:hypothetical protein
MSDEKFLDKSLEERIEILENDLKNEDLSDETRKGYEDLLEKLKDEEYQKEQEEIKRKMQEEFEKSKTSLEESKEEINSILDKYGVSNNKSIIELIKLMEDEYGYLILSMVDVNVEIFSKLNLENIVFNIKKGVKSNSHNVQIDEQKMKDLSENKITLESLQSEIVDDFIDYLNKMIEDNNNMIVSSFMTSLNFISEASFPPLGILRHNVRFF